MKEYHNNIFTMAPVSKAVGAELISGSIFRGLAKRTRAFPTRQGDEGGRKRTVKGVRELSRRDEERTNKFRDVVGNFQSRRDA